uniref:Uncharacterized protein n=1 Tax=Physcomitrium patens TaxID=3218 RepID=A0A2K1K2B1_PHYPA|nr:hypothetical protein PHYPA_012391 [Physcomitrium patens]
MSLPPPLKVAEPLPNSEHNRTYTQSRRTSSSEISGPLPHPAAAHERCRRLRWRETSPLPMMHLLIASCLVVPFPLKHLPTKPSPPSCLLSPLSPPPRESLPHPLKFVLPSQPQRPPGRVR